MSAYTSPSDLPGLAATNPAGDKFARAVDEVRRMRESLGDAWTALEGAGYRPTGDPVEFGPDGRMELEDLMSSFDVEIVELDYRDSWEKEQDDAEADVDCGTAHVFSDGSALVIEGNCWRVQGPGSF